MNRPIWPTADYDPYNMIGKHVVDDNRRTKMIVRQRIGDNTLFQEMFPTWPPGTRISQLEV